MTSFITVVSGADTQVGKTWVTARLLEILKRQGVKVAVRKPVQSFDPAGDATDSSVLAAAAGVAEKEVCAPHRTYPVAMAPPIAAQHLGREPFTLAGLLEEMQMSENGLLLIEGVGGPRSPLAADADTVAMAEAVNAGLVVVVCPAGLGAINAARLSAGAFAGRRTVVFLNRYDRADDVHRTNLRWLKEVEGLDVEVEPERLAARVIAASTPVSESAL